MKNFVVLTIAIAEFAFGLYFYSRGFLLTRHSLGRNNTCSDGRMPVITVDEGGHSTTTFDPPRSICWVKRRFRRAIWIVIDALRYDFISPISSTDDQQQTDNTPPHNKYYHNKLTTIADLLNNRPKNSLLYKFIADAPTTTLQRLKGLTTGSLPTFIDAGQNFGGTAIDEDNLIDQLVRRGKNITFMGDDTWMALFPGRFSRAFPFPSFDVKDLHTVDNGVLEHLFTEMRSPQNGGHWDVLIAHFLGVDHCGHKFGPNHPEMAAKLEQMDRVLRRVIEEMDSETVLFLLGDHGMTQSGDHGGDSTEEITSALFVYSPTDLHQQETNIKGSVNQIDIVPTMALLMDVPIPFSNLGRLLPELFPDEEVISRAVEANVLQVFRFTETYVANFRDYQLMDHVQPIFSTFYAHEPDELTVEKSLEYINRISRAFVECWAKFHIGWMALGIVTLSETLLWLISFLIDPQNAVTGRRLMLKAALFALSLWVVLDRQETIPPMVGILSGLSIIFHVHTIVVVLFWRGINGNGGGCGSNTVICFASVFAGFLLVAHGLSQFSNSFDVYEDKLSHYYCASLVIVIFLLDASTRKRNTNKPKQPQQPSSTADKKRKQAPQFSAAKAVQALNSVGVSWKSIIYCAVALVLLRSLTIFGRCREEQYPCGTSSSLFTLPFASLMDENEKLTRILVAMVSLCLLYWLPQKFLSVNGNLSGDSLFSISLGVGRVTMLVSTGAYWILHWVPERALAAAIGDSTNRLYLCPPLLCYAAFAVIITAYLICPYLITTLQIDGGDLARRSGSLITPPPPTIKAGALSETETVRRAYEHLKIHWRYYLSPQQNGTTTTILDEEPRVAIFGLATGYSAPLVAMFSTIAYLLVLILGDGFAFPLLAFTLVAAILLELCPDNGTFVFVTLLVELSRYFFYSFGHQPTFATIPWDAAFVGIPGNFRYRWVQGAMVVLRLSASHALVVFVLPLRACWRYYWKKLGPFALRRSAAAAAGSTATATTTDSVGGTEAELIQRRREGEFLDDVAYLDCTYLAAAAVPVLCSTLASTVHRRHLMVWKIFAPKFIFDGVHFLVTCAAVLVQYALVTRLHKAIVGKFSATEFVRQQHKLK